MDRGEEILGDTNATVECQPLLRQSQEDMSTTTEVRGKRNEGEGSKVSSGGVVEDRNQSVVEVRTRPHRADTKEQKMRIESIVRKRIRTRNALSR